MIVYVAECWDDEYGCPGGAIGVARAFQGALDILEDHEMGYFKMTENKIVGTKITPYGDGSNNYYILFKMKGRFFSFFSRKYSIREMELKE